MAEMKTLLFLYNPVSGKGKTAAKLSEIVAHFTEAGYDVTVRPTLCRGDGERYIRDHGAAFDAVVCSGGDGTLNEVVAGMVAGGVDVPLGYVPSGSANDTALTLRIPMDPLAAAETAIHGTPFPFDTGRFNGVSFVYVAAFGALTDVPYATPQGVKNVLGHAAYVLSGIKSLTHIRPIRARITCDGQVFEGDFIFGAVCNTLSIGGGVLKFDQEQEALHDGVFEVLLVRDPHNLATLGLIARRLLIRDYDHRDIVYCKAKHVCVELDSPEVWTLDGEDGGAHQRAEIECLPRPIAIRSGL